MSNKEEHLTMDEIPSGPFNPVPASKEPCEPTDSDVLCGRGGTINTHPGNAKYRNLVEERKRVYLTARFKREKRLISESIIKEIRNQNPPGRFLNRDTKDGDWYDIGDIKAREKTSQALRENLPKLRKELEAEKEAEKEAAAAKKKKEEEEEKERREQERLRREQQQWAAGGYSPYGHPPPHYSQHHGPPPPHTHQNYYPHQQAPPSRSFSSGGSGSASAASGSMGSGSYHHHHNHQPRAPHPPHPHHHNHHPRSSAGPAPAPAPGAPSGSYPFGLPPRNETKTESSVFNAVTSAFGFGPASSHPSAPPAPGPNHPGAPSNQHQHQEITADEADEVARLMLEDSPHPDSSTAAAAAIAEPIPASSSNLTSMDDKSVASGMFSMAQHILFSWDNKSTATGKTSDKTKDVAMGGTSASADAPVSSSAAVKTEGSGGIAPSSVPPAFRQQPFGPYRYEDEVSEEGQEVELLEMSSMDTEDMPPPPPQQPQAISRRRLSTTRRSRGQYQVATRDHEARDPSTPPPPGGTARQHLPSNVFLDSAPQTPGGAHSLDDGNLTLEGMSLCSGSVGTTLGGQSLVGVFDDHQSTNENTSSGESASISAGTRASSGSKGFQQPQQPPHSGGAGTGGLRTNHNNTMGPPLSPMVAPPRSRNGSETHSVGDHSLMSVRSESKASVASSYHRLGGSLALSPSTESALNACAASTEGISFPDEDMMMDGPNIKIG